jgi:hypothetical protein
MAMAQKGADQLWTQWSAQLHLVARYLFLGGKS